jgi:hypothetical protein
MIIDEPDVIPYIYIVFVVLFCEVRTLVESENEKSYSIFGFIFSVFQFLAFLLIPIADLDFQLPGHMFAASLIVTATFFREVSYEKFRLLKVCYKRNFKPYDLLHIFSLLMMIILALVFVIVIYTQENAEASTFISLVEYNLFFLIAVINMFNLRIFT